MKQVIVTEVLLHGGRIRPHSTGQIKLNLFYIIKCAYQKGKSLLI